MAVSKIQTFDTRCPECGESLTHQFICNDAYPFCVDCGFNTGPEPQHNVTT